MRGGFSSAMVMPYLDYELIKNHPKIIMGYSDITNILNGIYRNTGLVTYHAPMPTPNMIRDDMLDNGRPDAYSMEYLDKFIFNDWTEVDIKNPADNPLMTVVAGQADGEIVGGNLHVLVRAMGTDYFPDVENKILFIEEVKTHVPLCDLAWAQLKNAGVFDKIRGLIVGEFTKCLNFCGDYHFQDWMIPEAEKNWFADLACPTVSGLMVGHDKQTATIPIGANCKLDATNKTITISRQ